MSTLSNMWRLLVNCGFSELALWNSNSACWSSTRQTSSFIIPSKNNLFLPGYSYNITHLLVSKNHLLTSLHDHYSKAQTWLIVTLNKHSVVQSSLAMHQPISVSSSKKAYGCKWTWETIQQIQVKEKHYYCCSTFDLSIFYW